MFRRSLFIVLAVLLALSMTGFAPAGPTAPKGEETVAEMEATWVEGTYAPDQVLVKFKTGADAERIAADFDMTVERDTALGVKVLRVPAGAVKQAIAALRANPAVEYAEPNGIATVFVDPNDTYYSTCYNTAFYGCVAQWNWPKIQANLAWDTVTGSANVKVAVLDTGIDNSHPDLPPVALQKDFINNDNNAEDDFGHGTHVAGIIGALTNNNVGVAGANWNVSLMAGKVLDAWGSGSWESVANGIIWAADNGANVINMSLGGSSSSTTLKNAVDYAWNKGVVIACSAGNNGTTTKTYPASYTNCIAVAATNKNDNKASFSSYGFTWVDVAAPGDGVLSTMPNTSVTMNTYYGYKMNYDGVSGTSMAAPHVAGLAGLVWASGKCTTASCVRSRIEKNSDKLPGTLLYWRYGRINAYKAVTAP
jgi:thermitase